MERRILLNSIDKVKDFVNKIARVNADVELVHGKYVIDAKSVMGIFSLDLSNTLTAVLSDAESKDIVLFNAICDEFSAEE